MNVSSRLRSSAFVLVLATSFAFLSSVSRARAASDRDAAASKVTEKQFYPPTRMVPVELSVGQTTRRKKADGSFELVTKQICSTTGSVPLFDLGKVPSADQEEEKFVSCPVEFGHLKAELKVAGFVTLKHAIAASKGDARRDYKIFGYVTTVTLDNQIVKEYPVTFAMTDNLDAKTMVLRSYAGDLDTKNLSATDSNSPMKDDNLEINLVFRDL